MDLLRRQASAWAAVALANIEREFPHVALVHMDGPGDVPGRPSLTHPSFFGSYDWHSCVEMHWVLVRLLRLVPEEIGAAEVRRALDRHLEAQLVATEAANLAPSERPYGFGWALALADEIARLDDPAARRWAAALEPLTRKIVDELTSWLSRARYPVRSGVHANSAFSLSLALDFARRRAPGLAEAIESAALRWFAGDTDYPARYEPSGTDFLSAALTEAELLSKVLPTARFEAWLATFLPGLSEREPRSLFTPCEVSDPTDGQIAHLHGLNLSRAWCFGRLAAALGRSDPRRAVLGEAVRTHAAASLDQAVGSHYMVEHWLAAYAVLLASGEAGQYVG